MSCFSCSASKHYWEESGSLAFISFHQIFVHIDKVPSELSLLQTEQSPSSASLLSGCFSPAIISVSLQWEKSLQRGCKGWNRWSPFCSIRKRKKEKKKRQRGSRCKLISASLLVYNMVAKFLLSVRGVQRQGLLRPDCSLNLYVDRRN